jgi:Transposase DDE domain
MVASVTAVLKRLKTEWATQLQLEAIIAACEEAGYTSWRDRGLTPVTTIQLFLLQILHGNTACSHLPHLSGIRFSASAYCQARTKLPLDLFALLLTRLCTSVQPHVSEEGCWHGHRTFLVDGSGCSMPDTPALQEAFGQPTVQRPGCGFPVVRLLGLFHAGTGLLLKLVVAPLLTHDLALVRAVHPSLQAGDVLVADRGLCSYAHLALLAQAGVHAVLRLGARQLVDFTPGRPFVMPGVRRTPAVKGIPRSRWLKAVGVQDQLVTWLKPKTRPSWLTREALAALPEALVLREVRYHLGTPGFRTREITLVTTLLDAEAYRVSDLAELVPPALAGGDLSGSASNGHADGGAALQNGSGHTEGTNRLCHGLQPGAHDHAAIGDAPTHRRGADQLSGCAAVARCAEDWDAVSGLDREPHPTASRRAARQAAAAQELPVDDHTPASTASAVDTARGQRLISCHSGRTHD